MKQEQRRLLEMAGILRRNTPDRLLTEGEDEGGDDPFDKVDGFVSPNTDAVFSNTQPAQPINGQDYDPFAASVATQAPASNDLDDDIPF